MAPAYLGFSEMPISITSSASAIVPAVGMSRRKAR